MYKNTINLTDGCFPTIVVCPVERCPVRPGLVLAAAWRHCHDTRHGMDTADTAASYPSLDSEVSPARTCITCHCDSHHPAARPRPRGEAAGRQVHVRPDAGHQLAVPPGAAGLVQVQQVSAAACPR